MGTTETDKLSINIFVKHQNVKCLDLRVNKRAKSSPQGQS